MKALFRLRNIVIAIILLLVAGIGYNLWWAFTATPGVTVDYAVRMNEIAAKFQADQPGENAWPLFQDILSAAAKVRSETGANTPEGWPQDTIWPPDGAALLGVQPPPELVAAATRDLLTRFDDAGLPARLDELGRARKFVRDLPSGVSLMDVNLPACSSSRELARMQAGRMRLAHTAGNDAEVVRTFEQTLVIGRVLSLQTTLIERLVGMAIVELALNELRSEMIERPLAPAQLRSALEAIDRRLPLPPLSLAMEGERAFAMDAIQRTHTDNGHGDGRFIPSAAASFATGPTPAAAQSSAKRLANLAWFVFPTKKESIAKANAFYDQLNTRSALPRSRRAAATNADPDAELLKKQRFVTLALVLPALESALHTCDSNALSVAGTRLMLAIELFKSETGRYPASLAELSPKYLAEIPADPISERPWGYYVTDPAKDPRPYLLYSLGSDGIDNSGASAAEPHQALKLNAKAGTDFIINEPRK